MDKKKKIRKNKLKKFLMCLFFLYVATLIQGTYKFYVVKKQSKKEISEIKTEIKNYDEKISLMDKELKNVSEDEKIERVARNKLNMKKVDETVYKIID